MEDLVIRREVNGFTVYSRHDPHHMPLDNYVFNEVKDLVAHIKKIATKAEQKEEK
jgi:3-dehydroquinate dehydratase|tara:strand:+ start:235 stop:399 length:165 start_codon:yes stop_codon:yes gene_type:complete